MMATSKRPASRVNIAKVLSKVGYTAEAKRQEAEALAKRSADVAKLLSTDILRDKNIDAARLLMTTLGGELRNITAEDLRVFNAAANKLGKRFAGGITAAGVINASLKVDRDRANDEIHTAVVVKAHKGVLQVVTNAGPRAAKGVVRHIVHVEFPAFTALAATPADPKKLARKMMDGPLRLSCDCGRARFWYGYIQTRGGFKYGTPETAFPRIRNPKLSGVACKHLLRVMQSVIKDANFLTQAAKMIASAQSPQTKAATLSPTEQRAIAQRQADVAHHLKNRIETQAQSILRRAKGDPAKVKALYAAVKIAAERKVRSLVAGKAPPSLSAVKEAEKVVAGLMKIPMTDAARNKLISQIMAAAKKATA